jgi:hypothetical protein
MARFQREFLATEQATVTCGETDAQTLIDMVAPYAGARIASWSATSKTAGTGTGSFTLLIEEQGGTDLCAVQTVDPDATVETVVASGVGNGTAASATGVHLGVKTTKTGTITGSVVLILNVLWQM